MSWTMKGSKNLAINAAKRSEKISFALVICPWPVVIFRELRTLNQTLAVAEPARGDYFLPAFTEIP